MILDVGERLLLFQILPQREDYASLKSIHRVREAISFSPEEVKALAFEERDGRVVGWNQKAPENVAKDFPIDEWTTNKIRDILVQLNQQHQMLEGMISLYEKFVSDYE